jgi:iron complex transport system substrate-binding protein
MRMSHLLVGALAVIIVGISVVYLLTQPPGSVKTTSTSTAGVPSPTPITASPTATTQSASRSVLSTYPVTITDSEGRSITLEKPARKIVAQLYAVWVLAALNATDRVVGTSMLSFRGDPAFMKLLPKDVADIGSFHHARVNMELIVSLNPDVVIAPATSYYPESELEAKLPPHIKVVRLDFTDVKKLAQEIRTLGVIVNKTAEAERLVEKVERLLKLVKERVANATLRPKVYLEWHPAYYTPGRGSYWHEFIELAGGVNAFSDLEAKGFLQVSPESVVQRAPDVIVRYVTSAQYNPCAAGNATALARLRTEIVDRPGWSSIPAVANNRTYAVTNVYRGGYGNAVHLVLLAKLIHPELFADIDVDELINDLLRTMGIDRYCTGARVWVYPPLK